MNSNTIKINEQFDSSVLNIALDTINIGKQALIFVNTKKSAEKTAEDISKKIKIKSEPLSLLSNEALSALSRPTKQCERLSLCLEKGIAFHHAGLVEKQRSLIEDNFRKGSIKIICCTPTLSYGVNLPAFRAIIKDLKRYTTHGLTWIPVIDYMQMAGRAGRPSYDKEGQSIAIASSNSDAEKIIDRYLNGSPETIYSKLAIEPVLRKYVLSLVATNFTTTKKQLFDFFDKTFYAHQFKDLRRMHSIISKVINQLDEWELLISPYQDFISANNLDGDNKMEQKEIKSTLMGKRISELYIDPLTAYHITKCLRNASDKKVEAFSFLHMLSHTLEIRPALKVGIREFDEVQKELFKLSGFLLEDEPSNYEPEYEDFLNSIKTALMFNDWIEEQDEEFLMQKYNVRPGELRSKLEVIDWLLYATQEISKIMHYQYLIKEIIKLRLRIKYGIKEELLSLVRLENIGRVRARLLFKNGIKDIKDIKNTNIPILMKILGDKTALSIKKQLDQYS